MDLLIFNYFVFGLLLAIIPAMIANSKGLDPLLWFVYAFLVWPIALVHSLLAAHADHMACPYCTTQISKSAKICPNCRNALDSTGPGKKLSETESSLLRGGNKKRGYLFDIDRKKNFSDSQQSTTIRNKESEDNRYIILPDVVYNTRRERLVQESKKSIETIEEELKKPEIDQINVRRDKQLLEDLEDGFIKLIGELEESLNFEGSDWKEAYELVIVLVVGTIVTVVALAVIFSLLF